MKRIVFATGNKGKLREIREIMEGFEVVSMGELGLTAEAEETGSTFAENAFIKAREIYDKLLAVGDLRDTFVMADDSGLCIDALGGEPGVHSARFMGHDTDYHVKRMKLLDMLKDVPWEKRGARFTASICMIRENGEAVTETASMEGHIALQEAGEGGFGYDAIFEADAFPGKTTAEITEEEKNSISHRGKALRLIRARCNNV